MDVARNKYTPELVEAEEPWDLEKVDSDAYKGWSIFVGTQDIEGPSVMHHPFQLM